MTRRELESALLTLETTPVLLGRLIGGVSADAAGDLLHPRFEPLLDAIAAREDRLWGRWIELLISEPSPLLPGLETGVSGAGAPDRPVASFARFRQAREKNLRLLREAPAPAWDRAGILERGGILYLRELPAAMADGDRKDLDEILGARTLPEVSSRRFPGEAGIQNPVPEPDELAHRR